MVRNQEAQNPEKYFNRNTILAPRFRLPELEEIFVVYKLASQGLARWR